MDPKKHCDTCKHADRPMQNNAFNSANAQCCTSADYNSENYTHIMLLEDWGRGYCRFWTPKTERNTS